MRGSVPGLAVFDIDGTLTDTTSVDEECYAEAIRLEWGLAGISTDWGAYEHSTDNAIASEVSRKRRGRIAGDDELASLRDRFVSLLRDRAHRAPERFRPIAGACAVAGSLAPRGWRSAIATGGWAPSARLKLAAAGVPIDGVPAAFACDALPREEIIRIAIGRAERAFGHSFGRIVYLGDGAWDARASERLGIGFVGVGTAARAERLRAAGARRVVADFADMGCLIAALDAAATDACMKPHVP